MKKTIFLFGAAMILSATFTSCASQDTPAKPKNYYGVEPVDNGTPKEAYYAFAGGLVLLLIFLAWAFKKMKKR